MRNRAPSRPILGGQPLRPHVRTLLLVLCALPSLALRAEDRDIGDLVESIRKKHDVPALAGALVTAANGVEVLAAKGFRQDGDSTPVTEDDLWHLGSDTKAMTATLYAIFVERGVVKWDTTLGEVFHDIDARMDPFFKEVTADDLMAHRAGVHPDWTDDERTAITNGKVPLPERRAAFARVLLSKPPRDKPRDYVYSNSDFILVGAILEARTGKPWEELMRTEVFAPLGMKTAGFGPPGRKDKLDQPRGHQDTANGRKSFHTDNPEGLGPAGTVHASLRDWAHFLRLHLTGSEGTLTLSKESLDHMHSPRPHEGYVSGWLTFEKPWTKGVALTHDGSNTMWYCRCTVVPGRGFAVMACSNIGGGKLGHGGDACAELAQKLIDLQGK